MNDTLDPNNPVRKPIINYNYDNLARLAREHLVRLPQPHTNPDGTLQDNGRTYHLYRASVTKRFNFDRDEGAGVHTIHDPRVELDHRIIFVGSSTTREVMKCLELYSLCNLLQDSLHTNGVTSLHPNWAT